MQDHTLREALQPLVQELGRARPDRQRLLQEAFAFPALVAQVTGRRVLLFLDVLPCFSSVEPYMSSDGTIEIDAIGAGDSAWAVEVKWKGKSAGRKELEAFTGKITGMSVKFWYVSKSGFTTEARKYAADAGIMLSNEAELQELATLL